MLNELERGKNTFKDVYTTSGHKWFRYAQRFGEKRNHDSKIECTTIELLENDSLVSIYGQSIKSLSEISHFGIIHGLVFGDGSICNNVGQITLCGEKNIELLKYFNYHIYLPPGKFCSTVPSCIVLVSSISQTLLPTDGDTAKLSPGFLSA